MEECEGGQSVPCAYSGQDTSGLPGSCQMWQNHPDQHSDWWNEERASNVCRDVLHVEQDNWQCFGTWYKARRSSGKVKRPFRSYPFCLLLVLNVQSRRCSTSRQRKWTHVVRSCEFFYVYLFVTILIIDFSCILYLKEVGTTRNPLFNYCFPRRTVSSW